MKPYRFILLILIFLASGIFLSIYIATKDFSFRNDPTQMHRIKREVVTHFSSLDTFDFSGFSCPFSVLDSENSLVYQTSSLVSVSVDEALLYGDLVMPFESGTIIFCPRLETENESMTSSFFSSMAQFQKQIAWSVLAAFSVMAFLVSLSYIWLYKKVVSPFKNLEQFSKEVANGNLDFSLKMDRNNIFGAFSESFDLMREQLSAARQQEFLANQSKKELVASLSHDIKTPVTSIKVISEFLLATTDQESARTRIRTISDKAEQINLLVSDLFHATLEDLEELAVTPAETYSSSLFPILKEADLYQQASIQKIPDCMILLDPLRFSQVVSNLFYNAAKYAAPPVEVQFKLTDQYLQVFIQDHGSGVSEDDIPLLFQKFYRGKNATQKNGSGLGLYICKTLMEKMQGGIDCRNTENGFSVILLLKLA